MVRNRATVCPLLILVAVMVAIAAPLAAAADPVTPPWRNPLLEARPRVTATLGEASVSATLARSAFEQALGLGYRDGLEPGTGMLFVYTDPSPRSFWMKGMRFCLDIIWIEGGVVAGAAESVCPEPAGTLDSDLPSYRSPEPVRYVLEVPASWMDEHGIETGTRVSFDPEPATMPLPDVE